ncbi:MAG: hypothetical protein QOG79_6008 [Mycobacterium sp.]|nr:hypothetical protein [Mycobacterium sp.]MDT5302766.1 hypothetical protein [Mycobacterium sp.]
MLAVSQRRRHKDLGLRPGANIDVVAKSQHPLGLTGHIDVVRTGIERCLRYLPAEFGIRTHARHDHPRPFERC